MSQLVVTGADGRLGSALSVAGHLDGACRLGGEDIDLTISPQPLVPHLTVGCTVLHLAAKMGTGLAEFRASTAMLVNVLQACEWVGVHRVIYASSLAADPALNDLGYNDFYVATKRTGEALTEAWTNGRKGRIGISLRFGAYPDMVHPPSSRMTREALGYWVHRALCEHRPGYHVWNANSAGL